MNSLKPLLTVAVLAGIGYGVYVRINSGGEAVPPAGVASGWDAPNVQLGEPGAPGTGGTPWTPGPGAGAAPPFGPPRGAPVAPAAGGAPPYFPQSPAGAAPSSAPPFGAGAAPQVAGPPHGVDQMPPLPSPGNPFANAPPSDPAAVQQGAPPPAAAPGFDAPGAQAPVAGQEYAPPAAGLPVSPGALGDRYNTPSAQGVATQPAGGSGFAAVMEAARRDLEAGQLASALRQLSTCYDQPQLSPGEQQQLNQLLDQVAGTVVYSTQHLLEPPYEIQAGERLEDIAERYNVPWRLLAKINGIDDPQSLRPGERLKMVRGPFNAVISLEKRQLTLMLADGSYAGRFAIGLGGEHPAREGVYAVSDKVINPVYHGRDRAIAADDPSNPLGERWIGLGPEMGIHGTNRPENIGRTDLPGSISLSPRDVEDVYDILGVGSKVTIRR